MRQSVYIFLFFYSIFPAQQSAQQLSSEQIFKKIALTIKNRNYLLKGQFFTVQKKPILRYAKVLSKAGWGYIDTNGIEVIPPKYDLLEDFRDGTAKFSINIDLQELTGKSVKAKREGVINVNGKELIIGQNYSR